MRFMLDRIESGAVVIDTQSKGRVVATCTHVDEAIAIIAFLNGHFEIARDLHSSFLDRLKSST